MSKRHFEAIAVAIKAQAENFPNGQAAQALFLLADDLCDVFRDANPRFDAERFMEACGMEAPCLMPARTPEREQFLADVLITAVEGGVNYWAHTSEYRWLGGPKRTRVVLCDMEGDEKEHFVTIETIAEGLATIRKGSGLNKSIMAAILLGDTNNDGGEIDSDAADCIVQAGIFGEVIYG